MDSLTNDAKFLLSTMYSEYIIKRENGALKKDAVNFGNLEKVHKDIMSEWPIEDVKYTILELQKHGYLVATPASNTLYKILMTTEAIAMLEISFKDKCIATLDFAAKIKSAIPFI